jgi:hypothetical protein
MKRNIVIFWCLFLCLDVMIVAGIGEIWVRLFIPTTNICYKTDDLLGVGFCPNQTRYGYVEGDYVNLFITNSQGFHDYEYSVEKPETVFRIHIYGDSMIQGKALPIEDTVTQVVQKYLNSQGYSKKIEVMNMAFGDDSTSSQILTYQKIGQLYRPDLVLCYFSDDFGDNVYEVQGVSYSPYHELDASGNLVFIKPVPKDTTTLWEEFKKNCMLYRLFANKLFESKFYYELGVIHNSVRMYLKSFENQSQGISYSQRIKNICTTKGWPLTLELIKYFNRVVAENGTPFILVDGLKFNPNFVGETYNNSDLERYCNDQGIEYIAVYPKHEELKSLRHTKNYFFKDNHPTPEGNREISLYLAEEINDYLKKTTNGIK